MPRKSKHRLIEIIDRVRLLPTAGQSEPLHVATLGTAKANDTLGSQHVKRHRVNTYKRTVANPSE